MLVIYMLEKQHTLVITIRHSNNYSVQRRDNTMTYIYKTSDAY